MNHLGSIPDRVGLTLLQTTMRGLHALPWPDHQRRLKFGMDEKGSLRAPVAMIYQSAVALVPASSALFGYDWLNVA